MRRKWLDRTHLDRRQLSLDSSNWRSWPGAMVTIADGASDVLDLSECWPHPVACLHGLAWGRRRRDGLPAASGQPLAWRTFQASADGSEYIE